MNAVQWVARWLSRLLPRQERVHPWENYPLAPETRVILQLAAGDALGYDQLHATPERVLLAALEDEAVEAWLRDGTPGAVEAAREALLPVLASPAVAAEARAGAPSPRVGHMLSHAFERTRRRGATVMSRGDLVAGLGATEGETARLLAGCALRAVLDVSPRDDLPEEAEVEDAEVAVYVLNDDTSTMEDVLHILAHGFDLPGRRAYHRMLTTHYRGCAHVGTYPRARAEERLANATRHAAERFCLIRFHRGKVLGPPYR